jgi:hypothetical protein
MKREQQLSTIEFELVRIYNPLNGRSEHKVRNVRKSYK